MTSQQLLHELGVFLLGSASVTLVHRYSGLHDDVRNIATFVIGSLTVIYMAKIAGIF